MAIRSKKDSLIDEAQKFVQRGQFDKAAKAYEQILALDPSAINLRQKLAELLNKSGQNDAARAEFETIGKHFTKNGFYLKAIAVYKQLQKLFPADISLSLTLAELNEKLGLVANALSEYKLVYEFHEKAGNFPEALSILDRMQNVDPQSIPIKIKLAEAFIEQGKKDESYAIFVKAAAILSERSDNKTLSKLNTRIQQLFPDKPDFIVEILSEQIRQGNAASAIEAIQGLLRSNPQNKSAWDLVIKAYQQLEQPQRVKMACKHYLKFFPSAPVAMHGLIAASAAERNLAETLELLDQYEPTLIKAGLLPQLEQTYLTLDKIDPVNTRVLEGLVRVATAGGNEGEISAFTARLNSLQSLSGHTANESPTPEPPPVFFIDEEPAAPLDISDTSSFFGVSSSSQATDPVSAPPESEQSPAASDTGIFEAAPAALEPNEEEIEIDIDIDFDAPFGIPEQETAATAAGDNWLDSVGELFNTIDTAPRGVKFGNGMENSDAQSHFDLGQAFKEMGLYDEAINEFREAAQDPSRRVECLIMQCACLRERGEVEKAITMLLALLKPGLSENDGNAVKYELATCYEAAGDAEGAHKLLNEINAINPGFRDIGSRLDSANSPKSLDFSDEDLDDFGLK